MKKQRWMSAQIRDVVEFLRNALASDKLPRNDYRECAELVLVLLGYPPEDFTFKLPSGFSKVRWMAPIIYAVKIFLFRDQQNLETTEIAKLERFVTFVSLFYIKHWIYAPVARDAPITDLTLFHDMLTYESYDPAVSKAVIEKLRDHTWYLNQEFVVLNLFSSRVDDSVKEIIVEKLNMVKSKTPDQYKRGNI